MLNNMNTVESYFILLGVIQIAHSIEEISMGFAKRWPVWRMSQKTFVVFEIVFNALILLGIFYKQFPYREILMPAFNLLMFANGVWHLMWAGVEKKYVPGLITAPILIIVFIFFYISLFSQ